MWTLPLQFRFLWRSSYRRCRQRSPSYRGSMARYCATHFLLTMYPWVGSKLTLHLFSVSIQEIEELMKQIFNVSASCDLAFSIPDFAAALRDIQTEYEEIAAKNLQVKIRVHPVLGANIQLDVSCNLTNISGQIKYCLSWRYINQNVAIGHLWQFL